MTIRPYELLVGEWPTRFHLRIDPDGGGLLLANAAEAAWLSPVGVRMAAGVLEGRSDQEIVEEITSAFGGAPEAQVHADLTHLRAQGQSEPLGHIADSLAQRCRQIMTAGSTQLARDATSLTRDLDAMCADAWRFQSRRI